MDNLMSILTVILVILIIFIIFLAFIYLYISYKNNKKNKQNIKNVNTNLATEYTRKSIFDFMQFDKIENDMIVQDNEQRYLMVIECKGINYDLMSQEEKSAVESGFVQFLNTLRYPIQLYIQTRTLNIGDCIQNYKNRIDIIKKELSNKQQKYNKLIKTENHDEKQAEMLKRELIRIKNLYEYGQDVVENIQKTSQNKNVLRKHYYIVVPYYALEIGNDLLDVEEKKKIIFQELYTRAQSLIGALASCEVKCNILNSKELVELLYVAYNRDESEIYGIEKAIKAGYSELYTTAPDVLDKKMKALDKKIEENATQLAKKAINEAKQEISEKEQKFEKLVRKMAEALLKENQKNVRKNIEKKSKEKQNRTKKGWKINEKKKDSGARKIAKAGRY